MWVRDAYTAHYFEGWGEWARLTCDPAGGDALISHALFVELDQLKKNDLVVRISSAKIVNAFRESAFRYLAERAEQLKELAMSLPPEGTAANATKPPSTKASRATKKSSTPSPAASR